MNFILYLLIFITGITFGSFCTLAVYRIPLGKDITHERSFCPKCNHKLAFLDLIPVLSYLFLGGKCRYCGEKIRPRYFILEICSGFVFVLLAFSIQFNIYSIQIDKCVYLLFSMLYFVSLFILAGIDRERIRVENGVLIFLTALEGLYIIYLYIVENANMYRYVIYFALICIFVILNTISLHKKAKNSYVLGNLVLGMLMTMFAYEGQFVLTVVLTLLSIAFNILLLHIKKKYPKCKKVEKKEELDIPITFYLCVSNIIVIILTNLYFFIGD